MYIEHKYPCFTTTHQALLRQCPVNLSAALFSLQVATGCKSLSLHFPFCCDISAFVSVIHANFATIQVSQCSATIKITSLTFLLKYSVQDFLCFSNRSIHLSVLTNSYDLGINSYTPESKTSIRLSC